MNCTWPLAYTPYNVNNNVNKRIPIAKLTDAWQTKDLTIIKVIDMEDSHLNNALNFLEEKFFNPEDFLIYRNMLKEQIRRKHAEKIYIPF